MSSVDPRLSIDARQRFLQALTKILRPIVRLLIRSGIRYDEFADIACTAYVDSAAHDGIGDIRSPTIEQVSWATGIPRERVLGYTDRERAILSAPRSTTHVITEVLHKWHTDRDFLKPDGTPQDLDPNSASSGGFRHLVESVDARIDPDSILSELLQAKSAIYLDNGLIRALTRLYIWPQGSIAGIEYFGLALTDLSRTLEYNFDAAHADKKRLERSMFADRGVSPELLPAFHEYAQERATQFLNDLDDWFARFSDADTEIVEDKIVAGVYVFMYVEPPADTRPISSLTQIAQGSAIKNSLQPL